MHFYILLSHGMNVGNMSQIVVLDGKDERYVSSTATILKKQLAQYGYRSQVHTDFEPPLPSDGRVLHRSYRESLVWANKRLSELKLDEDHDVHIILGYLAREMAHLGSLIDTPEERRGYYLWLDAINHQMLELPRPAATFFLSFDKKSATEVSYVEIERLFPKDFTILDCTRSSGILSPDQTASVISTKLEAQLQPPKKQQRLAKNIDTSDKYQADFVENLGAHQQHLALLVEPVRLQKNQQASLEGQHRTDNTVCRLIEAIPKNELLLVDIGRYGDASTPLHMRKPHSYKEKSEQLKEILGSENSTTKLSEYIIELRMPYYLVDLLPTEEKKCSAPTIRHGYIFPEEILQDEKLSSLYEACYDAAHDKFNLAEKGKHSLEGSILGGHFVYVLASLSLLQLKQLIAKPEFNMYREEIIDAVSVQHPLTMGSFV